MWWPGIPTCAASSRRSSSSARFGLRTVHSSCRPDRRWPRGVRILGFVVSEPTGEQTEWKMVSIVLSVCGARFHLFFVYFTRAYKSSILSSANIQDIYCEKLLFSGIEHRPNKKKLISSCHRHNSVKIVFLELREAKKIANHIS